jgi:hypothetical protein
MNKTAAHDSASRKYNETEWSQSAVVFTVQTKTVAEPYNLCSANMRLKRARKILGVELGADTKEIKSRFRALAKEHHPDHSGDDTKFKLIAQAYDTVINWGGTDIVARKVEDSVFDIIWNEWLGQLSSADQDSITEDLEKLKRAKQES